MHEAAVRADAAESCLPGRGGQLRGRQAAHHDVGGHAPQVVATRAATHAGVVFRVAVAAVDDKGPAQGAAHLLQSAEQLAVQHHLVGAVLALELVQVEVFCYTDVVHFISPPL